MVRAASPQFRQTSRIVRVDKAQDLFVVLDGPDKAFLLADLATQPGQDFCKSLMSPRFVQRLVFLAPESVSVPAFLLVSGLDVFGGFLNQRERQVVTFLVVIGPVDQA